MYVFKKNNKIYIESKIPDNVSEYFEIQIDDIPNLPLGTEYYYEVDFNAKSIAVSRSKPDELTLLKAQLQAMTERNEFIEDVIAEMAMEVYKTV